MLTGCFRLEKKSREWYLKMVDIDEDIPESITLKLDWPEEKSGSEITVEWERLEVCLVLLRLLKT